MSTYPPGHEGIEFRIEWDVCANDNMQFLHCTWPVPAIPWLSRKEMTAEAAALHDKLAAVPGVETASSHRKYGISIERSRIYSFAAIRPKVEAIIREYFGVDAAPALVAAADVETDDDDAYA